MAQVSSHPPEASGTGRYRIKQMLGQGGMGAVYAALDTATGKRVALKRLSPAAASGSAALFEREYRTLASLRHPCIVEVYEYGSDAEGAYYTMELLEGTDLSKLSPMPWQDVCACLRDAASILGVLHARRLVHRDLSPRNLWRTPEGRLKLLDFGALTPFGRAREVVGTPPFMAPEALANQALDGRTDLFALGALGYWLLTGAHAFSASSLAELAKLHRRAPAAPSSLMQLLEDRTIELPPPDLDALIGALLRIDPRARPANTEELIDRLNASTELESEAHEASAQGYLESSAFVGRTRERERADQQLKQVRTGVVRAIMIEGELGIGRTRFLRELALSARIGGAVTVTVDPSMGARPYGVAHALALGLLEALPSEALRAAKPHADVLAVLSGALAKRLLGSEAKAPAYSGTELRFKLQTALEQWIVALSRSHFLALLVDDAHAADEESQALLAALAHSIEPAKLLLVATGRSGERDDSSAALLSFRGVATRMHLVPLTTYETLELLGSVFGQAPFLERLSERLHSASEGNPGHCLELAQHLVKCGQAYYREGAWTLPSELRAEQLPKSRREAQLAPLNALSADARALGQLLSIPKRAPLLLSHCLALSDFAPERTRELLAELQQLRILRHSEHGFAFVHESFLHTLEAERERERERSAHLRLAVHLSESAGTDRVERLRASVHFLHGGDIRRGHALLRSVMTIDDEYVASLAAAAPLHEEAYTALRAQGASDEKLAASLSTLAVAGYFVEHRYAARYGAEAIDTLERLLKLDLARRLRAQVGKKLSLFVALIWAALSLALKRPFAPGLVDAIHYFLTATSALVGTSASCIDPHTGARYADKLGPFLALGENHAASIVEQFSRAVLATVADRPSVATALHSSLLERLRDARPIRSLPPVARLQYIAGVSYARGVTECWRDGPAGLARTDELTRFGPLYEMNADQLRSSYYASQGDMVRAEQHRKRVDMQAVKLGSSWQVETWAPADATKTALRTNDALVMKRAAQELGRLSQEIPSLELEERHARGTYLVLRGKYALALPLLDTGEEPLSIVGWARTRGTLARAYNGLGQHALARETCLDVLGRLTPEDLQFPVMNLNVSIELALAESGLTNFSEAEQQLDALIALHAPNQGPLTLGALHEARARVALAKGDYEACRVHVDKMKGWYRPTGITSLLELTENLERKLARAVLPDQAVDKPRLRDDVDHLVTRVQFVLSQHVSQNASHRALNALQVALELSGADEGFIVMRGNQGEAPIHLGAAPSDELVQWAEQRLRAALADYETIVTSDVDSVIDENQRAVGSVRYGLVALMRNGRGGEPIIGVLALGFHHGLPQLPEPEVLRAIGAHLAHDVAL